MTQSQSLEISVRVALSKGAVDEAASLVAANYQRAEAVSASLMIAKYFRSRKLLPQAIKNFENTINYPHAAPPDAYADYARVLMQLGSSDTAISILKTGINKNPNSEILKLLLARALASAESYDEACEVIRPFIAGVKLNETTSAALAEAFRFIIKDTRPKIRLYSELLKEAAEAHPKMPDIQRAYGEILHKTADPHGAIKYLTEAIKYYAEGSKKEAVKERLAKVRSELGGPHPDSAEELPSVTLEAPIIQKRYIVAAITNVYNENYNMKIWLNHYGRQVGIEKCVVLDHGSNDGSTDDLLGAGVVRLARGREFNERHRMQAVNSLANSLLNYYDAVIYSDCDEMFVADPEKYENIVDYARQMKSPVAFAIGLNVRHDPEREADLDDRRPLLEQRTLVQFVSPMCKPLLINRPVSWGGGFHCCEHLPSFDDAYLFHLRHADKERALDRLRTTREIKFSREGGGKHHRRDEDDLIAKVFTKASSMKVIEDFDFTHQIEQHKQNIGLSFSGRYAVQKAVSVPHLNRIPKRFRSIL